MSTPLSTIVADVRLLSGLMGNQFYTDTDIGGMVSDLWAELFDRFVEANQHYRIESFEFTLAGGVGANTVDLPSNFQLGNGLELNPSEPRPRSVPYLSSWLNRNSLGASVLNIGSDGLSVVDRQYCFSNNQLMVFPATSAAGDYRLWYTPQADKLQEKITRSFDLVGANDTPLAPAPGGLFPPATGAWVVTDAGFTDDIPIDGSVTLDLTFEAPNTLFTGSYPIVGFLVPPDSTYDEAFVTGLASTVGFTNPAVGTGTYTYQPIGTLDALPDYADPWAIYLKLGASIAIREARQQDIADLSRRFDAQKQRVDSVLQNRQEEPTQPPLTGGRSFWDSL